MIDEVNIKSRQHKHYGYYIVHCSKDDEIGHALEQAIWITCFMRNVFIKKLRDSVHINYTNAAQTVAQWVEKTKVAFRSPGAKACASPLKRKEGESFYLNVKWKTLH